MQSSNIPNFNAQFFAQHAEKNQDSINKIIDKILYQKDQISRDFNEEAPSNYQQLLQEIFQKIQESCESFQLTNKQADDGFTQELSDYFTQKYNNFGQMLQNLSDDISQRQVSQNKLSESLNVQMTIQQYLASFNSYLKQQQ